MGNENEENNEINGVKNNNKINKYYNNNNSMNINANLNDPKFLKKKLKEMIDIVQKY